MSMESWNLIVDLVKVVITVAAGVATAVWTVVTWRAERQKERERREQEAREDHKRWASLFVNPFWLACDELQSRLYNILENGGLGPLNARHPDGSHA